MINKRLVELVPESKRFIFLKVLLLEIGLLTNIIMITAISRLIGSLYNRSASKHDVLLVFLVMGITMVIKMIVAYYSTRAGFLASKFAKEKLRNSMFEKVLQLGRGYSNATKTSSLLQLFGEGVDQLENYFENYLPQLFYSVLSLVTLFVYVLGIDFTCACVLMLLVPIIPFAIAIVQTIAKRILAKYWDKYLDLGDTFLENLEGLTTLKIYGSDEYRNKVMNDEANAFRKITMKVLSMQLNSITIMDLVAYGGAATGIILSVAKYRASSINIDEALVIILLSAEFFLPMRKLGSYFHVAMNGMAASKKITEILDYEVPQKSLETKGSSKQKHLPNKKNKKKNQKTREGENAIVLENVSLSYVDGANALDGVNISIPKGEITGIVGESGSGKSSIAAVLCENVTASGIIKNNTGRVLYVGDKSYIFKGTVRDNLLMANQEASDDELYTALKMAILELPLNKVVEEGGRNLSGGECQRLAIARMFIAKADLYIFDEATSSINPQNEEVILRNISKLSDNSKVLFITHRLKNVYAFKHIYVLSKGRVIAKGDHFKLMEECLEYKDAYNLQEKYEEIESNHKGETCRKEIRAFGG